MAEPIVTLRPFEEVRDQWAQMEFRATWDELTPHDRAVIEDSIGYVRLRAQWAVADLVRAVDEETQCVAWVMRACRILARLLGRWI